MTFFRFLCPFVCALLAVCHSFSQTNISFQKQAILLTRVIEKNHYSPRAIDDSFSHLVFDRFLERLDDEHLYFLAVDIRQLSVYRDQIDDELRGNGWNFLNKATDLYRQRLQKADSTISLLLQKPFDFSVSDRISFAEDSLRFASSEQDYVRKWHQALKYETIERIYDETSIQEKSPAAKKTFTQNEEEARKKVKSFELRKIKKILEDPGGFENYIAVLFCDIISSNFDPHTEFFSPEERQEFYTHLNSDGLYYGFSFNENDKGDLEITNLMPGGPAWKTGELNKGDVVLQVAFENKPPVDLAGASVEEASSLIDQAGNVRLSLTVRKTSGLVQTVSLIKEKIRNDENVVKSFILQSEKRIGYISLPGFYTDAEGESSASCANDVAKAIILLKKEGIDGLILDLRNNGGGSLKEALDMAGIFIDVGPLSLYRERDGKVSTLKDMNQGTIYDGPLLLLENGQSASASELLAAVLQDYHRAIIAGSPTYGKGTAQSILPLDTTIESDPKATPKTEYGFVKVTTAKFYRLTGNTTQQSGVRSDVVLPDILDSFKFREADEPLSLRPDTVKKNSYYKPLPPLPVAALSAKSADRIRDNKSFNAIRVLSRQLGNKDQRPAFVPLQWNDFLQWTKNYQRFDPSTWETQLRMPSKIFTVDNNAADKIYIQSDSYAMELNKNWLQKIQNDVYVDEAVHILTDYFALTNHK